MNEFARLLGRQLSQDLRALPPTAARWLSGSARVARVGNIAEMRAAARRALPKVIFDFVDGAAGDEVTAARNQSDFARLELRPRVFVDVGEVELGTTVLGRRVALPLLGAPMGLLGLVHPDGEVALARALHGAGSLYTLSAMASRSIEEVAAEAPGPMWFQLYVWRDRGLVRALVDRARGAGHEALVLTVDVPAAAGRDRDRRNGFGLPPRVTLRTLAGGAVRPTWSTRFVRSPRVRMGTVAADGAANAVAITRYVNEQFDPTVTWDDLTWFRELWEGPILVKGVLDERDARAAVDRGADGIIVSNHGGRQLDHAPSTIGALPAIVEAVGGDAEVYLDGGIRRGSDVMKALAAGARACLVGRPLVYGLGVGGEAGVARVVTLLREELRTAMTLAGCPSVASLDGTWLRARGG
ncbi:MAG: alpha-hydroxy-acid oxidizing protein [Solirubrobacterales bacterium]|nr:alpha-hydroxy-acid oxidizing protein [Solirubrobacterales bacterium]